MKITYLGHAGFCVETKSTIIIMDPWLSKLGAFDSAWFQYPQNHHMADFVQKKLKEKNKDKYLYISHDHKDHFDLPFLNSIESRDFSIIVADFDFPVVKNSLIDSHYKCKSIISLKDNELFEFKDGFLTLFIIDMELDCDSAILVKAESQIFLNINDAKIHERLSAITKKYGPIDVFTAQFSGAVWHPTCYKMSDETYKIICRNKNNKKFEAITKALELLEPKVYLPSAGPPCFLDPLLYHFNLQKINIYPRANKIIQHLNEHFANRTPHAIWPEIMPGDTLDVSLLQFTGLAKDRVKDSDFESYIEAYANQYKEYFHARALENAKINPKDVFERLRLTLSIKLEKMAVVRKNLPVRLYWMLSDYEKEMYCIDFQKASITVTNRIMQTSNFFSISSPAWQINKVLTGELSWPDFALTFRATLERNPDIYNTLIHGYITLEPDRLERFCKLFYAIISKKERITVECHGKTYSVLRYCPHQGGDLSYGWVEDCFLICPRHQWKYDLEAEGKCRYNDASIDAILIDSQPKKDNLEKSS